jgi:putative transposase
MTTRDLPSHLEEMYGVEVSPSLLSEVTDAVMDQVRTWQSRPLDAVYPILYLAALLVKMRPPGRVENRAVFVAMGVTLTGHKEVLGLWTSANEGAKFWLQILTEIRNRGLPDVLIACGGGLKGFPEAIQAVYPKTPVQLCLLHLVRNSLQFVNGKERKAVAADLRQIYRSATAEEAEPHLSEFERRGDAQYATIGKIWRRHGAGVVPLFAFPAEIRHIIYTTKAVESRHLALGQVIQTRASFLSQEAALKLLYLALNNVARKWKPSPHWRTALNHFMLVGGDRIEAAQQRTVR